MRQKGAKMTLTEQLKLLSFTPLFGSVPESSLLKVLQGEGCRFYSFASGESILPTEEKTLGVLLHGQAKIQPARVGKNVILRTLTDGDVFGAASLFCPTDVPLSCIVSVSPCQVLIFSEPAIRTLLEESIEFTLCYLRFLSDRVRFLNYKIQCFTAGSAEGRLALYLAGEEHDVITLPFSFSSLADMLDIGRASLYRAFDTLVSDGSIRKVGHDIRIINRQALLTHYL